MRRRDHLNDGLDALHVRHRPPLVRLVAALVLRSMPSSQHALGPTAFSAAVTGDPGAEAAASSLVDERLTPRTT